MLSILPNWAYRVDNELGVKSIGWCNRHHACIYGTDFLPRCQQLCTCRLMYCPVNATTCYRLGVRCVDYGIHLHFRYVVTYDF